MKELMLFNFKSGNLEYYTNQKSDCGKYYLTEIGRPLTPKQAGRFKALNGVVKATIQEGDKLYNVLAI